MEVCPREYPFRGRSRWGDLRSRPDVPGRTRATHAPVHCGTYRVPGSGKGYSGADVNTDEQIMAWIMDTYSMHVRHTVTAIVTGKTTGIGRFKGRNEATGRGLMIVCDEALKRLRMNRDQTRVIIQGFGNVGSNAARLMSRRGYKIIGVSKSTGGLYNGNGMDVNALWMYYKRNNSIEGFTG